MEFGRRDESEFLDIDALRPMGGALRKLLSVRVGGMRLAFVRSLGARLGKREPYYKVYRTGLYVGWTTIEIGVNYKTEEGFDELRRRR